MLGFSMWVSRKCKFFRCLLPLVTLFGIGAINAERMRKRRQRAERDQKVRETGGHRLTSKALESKRMQRAWQREGQKCVKKEEAARKGLHFGQSSKLPDRDWRC